MDWRKWEASQVLNENWGAPEGVFKGFLPQPLTIRPVIPFSLERFGAS